MPTFTVVLLLTLPCAVLAALECYDWQGKTVPDGIEFYPKKEDPCYMCRCDKGSTTMCKTVSCAPPNCLNWQKLSGCCQFECLDEPPGSFGDNYTGAPPANGVSDAPADHTMTDLGLRLVASTVTTFLILALLLFLIHRVRQRRLLVSLRRYRRRERFEDEDNVSYSPEYFGIQCPPYEDPPPPYSPPKPHIHHGELPPPYETINRSGNFQSFDENSQNQERNPSLATSFDCETQSVAINSNRVLNAGNSTRDDETDSSGAVQLGSDNQVRNGSISEPSVPLRYSGNSTRPSVPSTISTNIHHRNSLNGNQASGNNNSFSSVQHVVTPKDLPSPIVLGTAVLCMTHVSQTPEFPVGESRSDSQANEADIESSDSSGDCSPDSLELEREHKQKKVNFSPKRQSNLKKVNAHNESSGTADLLSEDAETTVKQFLDRQFGPLSRVRHYPTTMSQSWTSAVFMSTMPDLAEGALPNLRESCSVGSFSAKDSHNTGPNQTSETDATNKSKSAGKVDNRKVSHCRLLGNGRSTDETRTLPVGQAARVSYVEAGELSSSSPPDTLADVDSNAASGRCSPHGSEETDTTCSLTAESLDLASVSQLGESRGDSQRQAVLRELRLSHLLYSPPSSFETAISPTSPPRLSQTFQMHRSQSMNSDNSTSSVCSETGEKSLAGRIHGVAISNDAAYPENSYRNLLRSSLLPQSSNEETNASPANGDVSTSQDCQPRNDSQQRIDRFVGRKSNSEDKGATREQDMVNRNYFSDNWTNINSTDKVQTFVNTAAASLNNPDESEGQGHCLVNGATTQSPQKLSYNFEPNYNWNIHNKSINDKDVSSFCSPESSAKCQGEGRPGHVENISPARLVPSSIMRACASQLYNCETESRVPKKDKRPVSIQKRHSAGCFPVHKSSTDANISPSLEQKRSKVKGNPPRKRSPKAVNDIGHNGFSESIFAVPKPRTGRSTCNDRKDYGFVDTPAHLRNLQACDESVSARHSLHSEPATPVSLTGPSGQNGPQKAATVSKSHRRARSLGKSEHFVASSEKANKTLDNHSSRKSHNRRKKNCQSFPGSNAFHQELEHVLESQKQTIRTSVAKAMAGNGKKTSQNAVTQV